MTTLMDTEPLNLEFFVDDLVDFAAGLQVDDDIAFELFHDSDPAQSFASLEGKSDDLMGDTDGEDPAADTSDAITFVEKTYYMINTCEEHLAGWNPTGTGFIVVDTEKFAREVLPEFFKHRNFHNFVCELTLHGFRKSTLTNKRLGLECVEFRHPCFLRGNVELLAKITRTEPSTSQQQPQVESAPATPTTTEKVTEARIEVSSPQCAFEETQGVEEDADCIEAVEDLKSQISGLHGDVKQTYELFSNLMTSLTAASAQSPHPSLVRAQSYIAPVNYAMYHPMAMYTGACDPLSLPMNSMATVNPFVMASGDLGAGAMPNASEDPMMNLYARH